MNAHTTDIVKVAHFPKMIKP